MTMEYCFVCDGGDPARFPPPPRHRGCARHRGVGVVYLSAGMSRMRGAVGEAFARAPNERAVELLEALVGKAPPHFARTAWETLRDVYLNVEDDRLRRRAYAAVTALAAKTGDRALVKAHYARARAIAEAIGDTAPVAEASS